MSDSHKYEILEEVQGEPEVQNVQFETPVQATIERTRNQIGAIYIPVADLISFARENGLAVPREQENKKRKPNGGV